MPSTKLPAYDASPARNVHWMIEAATAVPIGDPARMASIIIASVDQVPAPSRIALGSDAYNAIAVGRSSASLCKPIKVQ